MIKFETDNRAVWFTNDSIQDVYLYDESGILAKFDYCRIRVATLKGCEAHENSDIHSLTINIGSVPRNARKIAFNKKDNFLLNTKSEAYFSAAKDLYIYMPYGSFHNMGKYIASQNATETCFYDVYNIVLPAKAKVLRREFEAIDPETYELKDGEAVGSGYGRDKDHAVIQPFYPKRELSLISKRKLTAGIFRSYYEEEAISSYSVVSPYYTKIVYSEEEQNRRKLSAELNEIGIKLSSYDLATMEEKGFTITRKEIKE